MATTPGAKPQVKNPNEGVQQTAPPPFRISRPTAQERYLKLLIYGTFGSGKTTLGASACNIDSMKDVLLVSAESGELSVEDYDLFAVDVKNYSTLGKVYEFLRQHCKARDADDVDKLKELESRVTGEVPEEPLRFRTVIIDSLTEVEAYCMNQLLGVTDSTKIDEEVQSAEWAEYKKNNSMITRLIRSFRDLPMHVIMVASEQYTQDETKKFKYSPNLTGKLSKGVQGFFDMVGYLAVGNADEKGNVSRRLYVQPSGQGKYDAKHRYAKFKGTYFDIPSTPSAGQSTALGGILKQTGLSS